MKIIFHDAFNDYSYSNDGAAAKGRMEVIMDSLINEGHYQVLTPRSADISDIERVHYPEYIEQIRSKGDKLFNMAMLAAGAAIMAAEQCMIGETCFAVLRPPGHHAYRDQGWGYCYFNNMAIALNKLRAQKQVERPFVLDFDAHTGDGTKDILGQWPGAIAFNPMADDSVEYMKVVGERFVEVSDADIIAVCAGFDSYIKDVGRKLTRFNFYEMGVQAKLLAKRLGHNRRFGILEGGYYQPDLGKNVLAFCQGLE